MAIPKKGSRIISVDGIYYRWLIRKKPTYTQADYGSGYLHVAIDIVENTGSTLIIYTNYRHPNDIGPKEITPVTPFNVSNWIKNALTLGWTPQEKGAQFSVKIDSENNMHKC